MKPLHSSSAFRLFQPSAFRLSGFSPSSSRLFQPSAFRLSGFFLRLSGFFLSLQSLILFSQVAPSPSPVPDTPRIPVTTTTSATTPPASDDIVVMETFNITESRTSEWVSTQSLTGARTAEQIVNLPYQMQIVTDEFMKDFNLTSVVEQLSAVSGMALQADVADPGSAGSTGFRGSSSYLRGFAAVVIRDGFRLTQPGQPINTRQVEVIKGPGASALYGSAEPGGLVNYISERPTAKPFLEAQIRGGNSNQWSTYVKVNSPLVPGKLFFLGAADIASRDGRVQYAKNETRTYIGSMLYRPWKNTNITVTWETQKASGRRNENAPSLQINAVTSGANGNWERSTGTITGIYWDWVRAGLNFAGPHQWYNRSYDRLHIQLEHKLSKAWQVKFAYQWQYKKFDQNYYYTYSPFTYNPITETINNVVPQTQFQTYDIPYAFLADIIGNFKTGKIRHAFQISADATRFFDTDMTWRLPSTAANAGSPYYTPIPADMQYPHPWEKLDGNAIGWRTDWFSWDNIRSRDRGPNRTDGPSRLGSAQYLNILFRGVTVGERMFLFNERLVLLGLVRCDHNTYDRNPVSGTAPLRSDPDFDWSKVYRGNKGETTYTVGGNWRILPGNNLIGFANYCTSFNSEITVDNGTREVWPSEHGRGADIGIKIVPSSKFSLVASWYWIKKFNCLTENQDYVGTDDMSEEEQVIMGTIPQYWAGTHRVYGADLDFTWVPTRNITFKLGLNYTDTKIVDSGYEILLDDRFLYVPNKDIFAAVRYRFPGILKGLSAGVTTRYTGSWLRQYYYPQTPARPEYLREVIGGSTIWNAFIQYQWRTRRTTHTFQINGNNVFDKFYISRSTRNLGARFAASYTVKFQ